MTAPIEPMPPAPPSATAAPSSGRMSPALLIVIVAVGVLLLGGLVFAIGWLVGGSDEEAPLAEQQVIEETTEVITPIPDAPAPDVELIPEQPSLEPIPGEPDVEPLPTESGMDVPAEPTSDPMSSDPMSSGQTIEIGSGISAVVPDGWDAEALDEATVVMSTESGGAVLGLYTAPAGATGAELIAFYIQETLSPDMPDLETTQPEPLPVDVPSVTSAATSVYVGTYVSQQGSTPLEGIVWAFIRADGTALVIDGYWSPGVDIAEEIGEIAVSALTTM